MLLMAFLQVKLSIKVVSTFHHDHSFTVMPSMWRVIAVSGVLGM